MSSTHQEPSAAKPTVRLWIKRSLAIVLFIAVLDALLFVPAGRLDWAGGWVFSSLYAVLLIVFVVWTTLHDPGLMQERSRRAENVKVWDKVILGLYTVALLALPVVAGLDARFRWSDVPLVAQALGLFGLLAVGLWLLWVTRANSFLSRYARIQDDRAQQVVTTGPYRFVRHPMYAALVPFAALVALVLGSWWALVPGGIIAVLFVIRTALEDRMLLEELPGYREYAERVRYRLYPGIW